MVPDITNTLESLRVSQRDIKPARKWPVNVDKLRKALKDKGFGGRVVARCDAPEVYKRAIHRWAENLEGWPAMVVFPETEEQVSVVVRFAADTGYTVGLRCGGHNGAPMTHDTILVDMSSFKDVKVDTTTNRVTFGGGCTWGDVYEVANAEDLTVVGGGYHGVGVGGYLSGGGYSWWSGKHGMGCDNVVSARMCLADGSIVTVNDKENTDLFYGIRGGHGQFGVILEFTVQAYPGCRQALTGMLGYRPDQLEQVLEMLHEDFFPVRTSNESIVLGFMRLPPNHDPVVAIMPWVQGDGAYTAKIKNIFTSRVKSVVDFTHIAKNQVEIAHGADKLFAAPGARRKIDALTTTGDIWEGMVKEVWDKWHEFTENVPDCRGSVVLFECHDQDGIASRAGNATAWRARDPHYYVVCTGTSMTPATDELSRTFVIETAELIGAHHLKHTGKPARQWGLGRLDEKTQEFTYTYATDRERIKEIKEQRDPMGVFQSPMGQQTHSTLLKKIGGSV